MVSLFRRSYTLAVCSASSRGFGRIRSGNQKSKKQTAKPQSKMQECFARGVLNCEKDRERPAPAV
jgi:hypothetical protein